jgi:hypothetical protein
MADDTEDVGTEPPAAPAPASEPASDPAEQLSSDIRDAVKTQRQRGEDGKFKADSAKSRVEGGAAKGVATGAGQTGGVGGAPDGTKQTADIPEPRQSGDTSGHRPPAGFSVASKQAWDSLPEHVRADIAKREADVNAGLTRYGGLAKFAEEAERNGTSLQNAVNDYVTVESELRRDFVGGVEFLCRRLGVQPQALLAAMAQRYLPPPGTSGQTSGQPQPQPQPQYDPNAIATHAANMIRTEFQTREINSQIEIFAQNPANRFFDNVRQDMSILVQAGKAADLQTAYEAACWLNPDIRAILLEEARTGTNRAATATAVRAQNAAKAVTGAPANSHVGDVPRARNLSLDDEIRAAIKIQRGNA